MSSNKIKYNILITRMYLNQIQVIKTNKKCIVM